MRVQSGSQEQHGGYERVLQLPRWMIIATLWLIGVALFGLCVLVGYILVRLVVGLFPGLERNYPTTNSMTTAMTTIAAKSPPPSGAI